LLLYELCFNDGIVPFFSGAGHTESGNTDNFNHLHVWKNDIPAGIENAIQNKTLSETLVALSPLGI